MEQFIAKFGDHIEGIVSGFDRLVFRGTLRSLSPRRPQPGRPPIAMGMEQYLWRNQILFKDYSQHVKRISERVREASLQAFHHQGVPVQYLQSSQDKKEEIARNLARKQGIEQGLGLRSQHSGAESVVRPPRHAYGGAGAALPSALSLSDPSGRA